MNSDVPSLIFALSDRLVDAAVANSPLLGTFIGVPGHDHRWDDLSPAGADRSAALWRETQAALDALTPQDEADELAKRVILAHCDEQLEAWAAGDHLIELNSIVSPAQMFVMAFDVMPMATPDERERVISRLEGLGLACKAYRESLEAGRLLGRAVARRQVLAAMEQCRAHAGETSFFLSLPGRFGPLSDADTARTSAAVTAARQAFGALADYLESSYLPSATDHDAVGRERYLRAMRRHLGMRGEPEELYAWGVAEVLRIEAQMRAVAADIRPGATVAEVIHALQTEPAYCAATADEFIALIERCEARALERLDGVHFDVPPLARQLLIKRAPPGAGPIGAYYLAPSADFSRPGGVYYQLEKDTGIPTFDEISTAFHEGFPGHHLQIATQIAQADRLSRFQRLIASNTGHAEGWALYAEQLMHELGFLDRPEYVLGMYVGQLMRALRVVVDIGLHLELPVASEFGAGGVWSFEAATRVLEERGFMTPDNARSEVTRYLGWPGQAIAYKIGQRVILGLRDERRGALGPAFDPRPFHASILNVGSVGLDLLAEWVRRG
ncbi:MAG: DUF885 domain-containing protein [Myxococcales bacterium]|nr:DUF885 domain-containing protein [Myxococcales bacterium]